MNIICAPPYYAADRHNRVARQTDRQTDRQTRQTDKLVAILTPLVVAWRAFYSEIVLEDSSTTKARWLDVRNPLQMLVTWAVSKIHFPCRPCRCSSSTRVWTLCSRVTGRHSQSCPRPVNLWCPTAGSCAPSVDNFRLLLTKLTSPK